MAADEGKILRIVLTELAAEGYRYAPVGISAKHVHLSEEDLHTLFGVDYQLHPLKDLVQPGQYAAQEQVTLIGPKGRMEKVRIIGPVRKKTQIELSSTDTIALGLKGIPVRMSGELEGSPGIMIEGPAGKVLTPEGTIVAARHIHLSSEQARAFSVEDRQAVNVRIGGERGIIFENVICRVGQGHELEFHVDTDEANAAGIKNGDFVEVIPADLITGQNAHAVFDPERIASKALAKLSGKPFEERLSKCMPSRILEEGCTEVLDLVTEQDVNDAVKKGATALYCSRKALITPSAADRASEKGISILRTDDTAAAQAQRPSCQDEVLELITASELNAAFRDDKKEIFCTKDALITPAAMERIAETGIRIIRV